MMDDERFQPEHNAEPVEEHGFFEETIVAEVSNAPIAPPDPQQIQREFDELTLADVVGQFFYAPIDTIRVFWNAIQSDEGATYAREEMANRSPEPIYAPIEIIESDTDKLQASVVSQASWTRFLQLFFYVIAMLMAVWGATIMVVNTPMRTENPELIEGFRRFVWAGMLWLAGEIVGHRLALVAWLQRRTRLQWLETFAWGIVSFITLVGLSYWFDASDEQIATLEEKQRVVGIVGQGAVILLMAGVAFVLALFAAWYLRRLDRDSQPFDLEETPRQFAKNDDLPWYMRIHPARVFLVMLGALFSTVTWFNSINNQMTDVGFIAWFTSVACWVYAFALRSWWNPLRNLRERWGRWVNFNAVRDGWVVVAMVVVLLISAHYRLSNLNGIPAEGTAIPQEMTSDHVEKLLDAQRVKEGSRDIFFANNGGREPFQMYAMALFSELPGQSISHASLKLLAVLQSLLTIPFFFWLGWDLFRTESRLFRQLMGIVLAAFVAVSFWDTTITRLALRIILTPLVTIFVLVYLSRAMRGNQIGDFLKAGLALGFGLYTYQAVRMLPVVIVMAAVLVFVWGFQRWSARRTLVLNMLALILISFTAFLPMYHYSTEHPEQFLRRTFGRLLGDEVIEERLPSGVIVMREPNVSEQLNALVGNLPVLFSNLRNAVLMFNWKGDVAWVSNFPNYPSLDQWTGALFAVGTVAWVVLAIRRRDLVYVMIPFALLIMLLPSALSIAYPIENPSFTRTSGALPMTYLIVALPLVMLADAILQWERSRLSKVLAASVIVLPLMGAYSVNYNTYMTDFAASYLPQSLPHSDGGRILQGFAVSDGAYGNAFMIAYENWWDHRAVGLASGLEVKWPNGVYDNVAGDASNLAIDYLPSFMQQANQAEGLFHFYPDRDILVFYSRSDAVTSQTLKRWFPTGRETLYPSYQPGDEFLVFRAPALGQSGYERFIQQFLVPGQ